MLSVIILPLPSSLSTISPSHLLKSYPFGGIHCSTHVRKEISQLPQKRKRLSPSLGV